MPSPVLSAQILRSPARAATALVLAVAAVAAGAQIDVPIPGSPVPQSLQTLAVLLVGGWLGARLATVALVLYLAVGAVGLPVFAGGAAGFQHLGGVTAGYLVGFVVAAGVVGWLTERAVGGRFVPAVGHMLLGHLLILGLGVAWMTRDLGFNDALEVGFTPFVVGAVVKSMVAGFVVAGLPGWVAGRDASPGESPAG